MCNVQEKKKKLTQETCYHSDDLTSLVNPCASDYFWQLRTAMFLCQIYLWRIYFCQIYIWQKAKRDVAKMSHLVFWVLAEKAQKQGHHSFPTENIKPPALEGHQMNYSFHGQLHDFREKKKCIALLYYLCMCVAYIISKRHWSGVIPPSDPWRQDQHNDSGLDAELQKAKKG